MAKANSSTKEHGPELSVVQARQGRSGRPIVWVLAISTALIVVGLAAVWLHHAPGFSRLGAKTAVSGHNSHTPLEPARQKPDGPAPANPSNP